MSLCENTLPSPKKQYAYTRVSVKRRNGKFTTISINPAAYNALTLLARGSLTSSEAARVSEACREAANELIAEDYTGKFSAAVRKRAVSKLRAVYSERRALQMERAEFPEGVAVSA